MSATLFRVQLGVSIAGMAVCIAMLARGKDPAVYLPVVTSIVGYWLPAPIPAPGLISSLSTARSMVVDSRPEAPIGDDDDDVNDKGVSSGGNGGGSEDAVVVSAAS